MNRRRALSIVGGLGLAAVAGCVESAVDDGDTSPYGGGQGSPDGTPTSSPSSRMTDTSFTVRGAESGTEAETAEVRFDDAVLVEGTTTGNNGCYTAELADASYDGGRLEVTVEAVEQREEDEVCTQAIVRIGYEATFAFEGSLPEVVVVHHEGATGRQTVAEVER